MQRQRASQCFMYDLHFVPRIEWRHLLWVKCSVLRHEFQNWFWSVSWLTLLLKQKSIYWTSSFSAESNKFFFNLFIMVSFPKIFFLLLCFWRLSCIFWGDTPVFLGKIRYLLPPPLFFPGGIALSDIDVRYIVIHFYIHINFKLIP